MRLFLCLFFLAPPAGAVMIQSTYSGVITSGNADGIGIPIGTVFQGTFIYDTNQPDQDPNPGHADYTLLLHEVELVGVVTLVAVDYLLLQVRNDIVPNWDNIVARGATGHLSGDWSWWISLDDFQGPPGPLTDESVPSPIPTGFEEMEFSVNHLLPMVRGTVNEFSSTIIPEPGTGSLVTFGLLALSLMDARRYRRARN